MHPMHPTCLRHTFVVYTGDSALVANKRKPSVTECRRRRVPQLHVARPRTRLIRTAQSRVPRESRLGMRHTRTHPPFVGTPRVSRYQKGKTNPDVTEARESEWQWHQLGHMQVCTLLQTDNHTNTSSVNFYRPDALPDAQTTGKVSPYSITERRVLELIPVLDSQPAGDVSHKPGGRLP